MSDTTLVTALFKDKESAEKAYRAVAEKGYGPHDVSVAMTPATREAHFAHPGMIEEGDRLDDDRAPSIADTLDDGDTELGTMAVEGGAIGAGIGGTIGAIAAALAALGTALALPGIGLFMAGPIAAALVGAGAGLATGGLVGALVGWGIPEERVKHYERGLHDGGILVAVHAKCEEDARHFADIFHRHHGEHVHQ